MKRSKRPFATPWPQPGSLWGVSGGQGAAEHVGETRVGEAHCWQHPEQSCSFAVATGLDTKWREHNHVTYRACSFCPFSALEKPSLSLGTAAFVRLFLCTGSWFWCSLAPTCGT